MPLPKADMAGRLMATLDAIALECDGDHEEMERYLSGIHDHELKSVLHQVGGARAAIKWYDAELEKGASALQRAYEERMRNDPEARETVEWVDAYFKAMN
jgi:hypothetical protein